MSRRVRGFLLVLVGLAAVIAIIGIAVVLSRGVERGTVVELTISGSIEEERDESLQGRFFQGDVTTIGEIRGVLERARRDDRVVGVMAVIKPFRMGLAKTQELRQSVMALRESGKFAVAFIATAGEFGPGNNAYYLASAFEDLTLSPAGDINLAGVSYTALFLRGILDKIGVYPDFDSIGAYKNARNLYTEKAFTPEHREASEQWVEDFYRSMADEIAEARKKTPAEVEAIIDKGPYIGDEALQVGLVDRLGYYDEFRDAVKERAGGRLRTLKWKDYLKRRSGLGLGPHKIAVVHATGIILLGKSGYDPAIGFIAGSDSITAALREAREDRAVKAIILRVDSPGGSAVASDAIWRETQLARKEKPVVASYSDVAASGGYYISCGADRIVAEPNTVTASIGVVWGKMVMKGLYDWLGLSFDEVQRGRHADFWNELRKFTPEEKDQYYWKFMRKIYSQFVARVAEGREMTPEAVDKIGQGHVWTGRRAKELGLVDELGGFYDAVRVAKELAKIPEDEDVRYIDLPEKPSLWQSIWGREDEAVFTLDERSRTVLRRLQVLGRAASLSGGPALLMPSEPEIAAP